MSFRSINVASYTKFNSISSKSFLEYLDTIWDEEIVESDSRVPSKSFAPSSMRCERRSWFRLRGVTPDKIKKTDKELDFSATVGTACHEFIQKLLKKHLKSDWISVSDYLKSSDIENYKVEESGYETKVFFPDYPIKFSCDGLILWNNTAYLLEIKSTTLDSWKKLTDPKSQHIYQAKTYCTLLKLSHILFVYIDRQFGSFKVFEISVSDEDKNKILSNIDHVKWCLDNNIAPPPLAKNDPWCSENMCPYFYKCKEYGR